MRTGFNIIVILFLIFLLSCSFLLMACTHESQIVDNRKVNPPESIPYTMVKLDLPEPVEQVEINEAEKLPSNYSSDSVSVSGESAVRHTTSGLITNSHIIKPAAD